MVAILLGHCYAQPLPRRVLEVRRGVGRLAGDVHRGHPRARAHAGLQHRVVLIKWGRQEAQELCD